MKHTLGALLLGRLLLGCGGASNDEATADGGADAALPWDQGGEDLPEYSLGRLLIADPEVGVTILDLDTESVAGTLPMLGAEQVFAASSGRYSFVDDPAARALRVVDPGQWLLSHIDHFHVADSSMGVRAEQLTVQRVSSLVSHEGWVTVVDPGAGQVQLFQERGITAMAFRPVSVAVQPHAGVALVSHAHLVMSEPTADGEWGIGVRDVLSPATRALHVPGCSEATAIAADGSDVYVACLEGVLHLRWTGNDVAGVRTNWVRAEGSATRPTLVRTAAGVGGAILRLGKRDLALLLNDDSVAGKVSFETDVLDVQVRRQANAAIVLTADGQLHEVLLPSFARDRTVRVVDAIEASMRPPRFALSHAYAYLADARSPDIAAVRLRTMQVESKLYVGGRPSDVSVAGMPLTYTDDRE